MAGRGRLKQAMIQLSDSPYAFTLCGMLFLMIAFVLIVVGAIAWGNAEHEKAHGWSLEQCTVLPIAQSFNECVYFRLEYRNREYCGVPAEFAARGGFETAPACTRANFTSDPVIRKWRRLAETGTSHVECWVPKRPLAADTCATAALHSGPLSAAYRAWDERFVYIETKPGPAIHAIRMAVQPQEVVGIVLVAMGILCVAVGTGCCVTPQATVAIDRYRTRWRARRKARFEEENKIP